MLSTFRQIVLANWQWRSQTWRLAITEIQKQVRGAVLGWIWLLITPAVYVGVFWFALAVGLRTNSPVEGVPYIFWLTAAIVPWFFMSDMISGGSDVYHRYSYLVNRLRFPIPVISSFYVMAKFIIFLVTMVLVLVVMVVSGVAFSLYNLQFFLVAALMYLFWLTWSMWTSPLSALSKDFHNLLKALSTPFFWLSGILFDATRLSSPVLRWILAFNPVTFFASSYRAALCEHYWIWDRPQQYGPFLAVFLVLLVLAVRTQRRLGTVVADVL